MIIIKLYILSFIMLLIPFGLGYTLLTLVGDIPCKRKLYFAGIVGMLLEAAIAFVLFLLKKNEPFPVQIVTTVFFIILLIVKVFKKKQIELPKNLYYLSFILLTWLSLVSFQMMLPIYGGAYWYGDWWMHYDISLFYLGLRDPNIRYFDIYSLTSRTPLFNLLMSYNLAFFGSDFYTYQLSSLLPSVFLLLILPIFISQKPSLFSLGIIVLNPYIYNMMIFPWPKVMCTTFILLSLHYYLKIRDERDSDNIVYMLFGFFSGVATLTHQSALIYIFAIFIDFIFVKRKKLKSLLKGVVLSGISMILVIGPWVLWGLLTYGLDNLIQSAHVTIKTHAGSESLKTLGNAILTLLPYDLIIYNLNYLLGIQTTFNLTYFLNAVLRGYFSVLIGALGIPLICYAIISGMKRTQYSSMITIVGELKNFIFLRIIIISYFGLCYLQPDLHIQGLAGASMMPIVVLILLSLIPNVLYFSYKARNFTIILMFIEFILIHNMHMIVLNVYRVPYFAIELVDENFILKNSNKLLFLRDLIPSIQAPYIIYILTTVTIMILTYRNRGKEA